MSDEKKSRAEIAREYMKEHAKQVAEREWQCRQCGKANDFDAGTCAGCGAHNPLRPPARFPSTQQTRRGILDAVASTNTKYARPFDGGRVASFSLIGTESWADYGAVVLQMATLDTLLSIEEKLTELLQRLDAQ